MKKFLVTFLFLAFIAISADAQNSKWSFAAGVNPGFGKLSTQIRHSDDEVHNLDYKQSLGISVAFERQGRMVAHLTEIRFVLYEFDEYSHSKNENFYPLPSSFDDIKSYSLMQYTGLNFMVGERFQLPMYLGLGAEYLHGEPYHNITGLVGFKLKAKYNFTNRIGIFGGFTYVFGLGGSRRGIEENDDTVFLILTNRINYDLGIAFTL